MIRTLLRGVIVLMLITAVALPAQKYIRQYRADHQLALEEKNTIGSTNLYNPRVKEIQRILNDANMYFGLNDGIMGEKTRRAIEDFQKVKGLPATGRVDARTFAQINKQMLNRQKAAGIPEAPGPKITTDPGKKDSAGPAQGKTARQPSDVQGEVIQYRLTSRPKVEKIQLALKKSGYFSGKIDGRMGPQTQKAIAAFQKSQKLESDGVIGVKTWEALRLFLPSE